MWHGRGKPLISSFSQKIPGPWLRKNSTWDSRRGEEKLDEGLSWSTTWNRSIVVIELSQKSWQTSTDLFESFVSCQLSAFDFGSNRDIARSSRKNFWKFLSSPSGRSPKLCQVFSWLPSGVFSQSWDTDFSKKTRNQGFSSPVSHLVFIVLWIGIGKYYLTPLLRIKKLHCEMARLSCDDASLSMS